MKIPQLMVRNPNFESDIRASFEKQGLMQHMRAYLGRVELGYVEVNLPFHDGVSQQHGYFHGGAISAISDSAGGYAALSVAGEAKSVLGVEFKINLMAPGDGDYLSARAQVIKSGKTLVITQNEVYSVTETDGGTQEKLCALMQMTTMIVELAEKS